MRIFMWCSLVLFACGLFSCSDKKPAHKFANPDIVSIWQKADARDKSGILPYLTNADSTLRYEALLALASQQDTTTLQSVAALLADADAQIRQAAIYALAQMSTRSALDNLMIHTSRETDPDCLGELYQALGKRCPQMPDGTVPLPIHDQVKSIFLNATLNEAIEYTGWAKGVVFLNRTKVASPAVHGRIPYLMQHCPAESRVPMAYALAGAPYNWAKDNEKYLMSWVKSERSEFVRVPLMNLLGQLGHAEAEKNLIASASIKPANTPVASAAARALKSIQTLNPDVCLALLDHPSDLVALEFLQMLSQRAPIAWHSSVVEKTTSRSIAVQAAALEVAVLSGDAAAGKEIWKLLSVSADPYDQAACLHALSAIPEYRMDILETYVINSSVPVIRYSATECLIDMQDRKSNTDFIDQIWMPAWKTEDVGVCSLLAAWIVTHPDQVQNNADVQNALSQSIKSLILPRDIETYDAIAAGLTAIGSPQSPAARDYSHSIDWKLVSELPRIVPIEVTTTKGIFKMELHTEEAPGSVSNFVKLTREGFFNEKAFHRVVPNFVVQTGCPRGDGMGGLDYTIRSEFNAHDYARGSVGLASSGKDTESCQWFVTHVPTYWLEGRYTLFGQVTEGMDVIEKILVGDRVISVKEIQVP